MNGQTPIPHIDALAAMWTAMMIAMMMPAAVPSARVYARMSGQAMRSVAYVAGYLGAWGAIGLAFAFVHWSLRIAGLLRPDMRFASESVAGAVLIAAGIYQFSSLKARCVSRCRSPLGFMLGEWRDGAGGAFVMGLSYSRWCIGCCWLLMAVLFVVGAMSLAWALLISGYVLAERLLPYRSVIDRVAGAGLAAWGSWLVAAGLAMR